MSTYKILKHARQARNIVARLLLLNHTMTYHISYPYNAANWRTSMMDYQLSSIRSHLDEVIDELEWRDYLWDEIGDLAIAVIMVSVVFGLAFLVIH